MGPASIEEEEVNCHVVPYRIVFLQNIIFNMRCKIQIAKSENLISNSIVCMNCEILGWTIWKFPWCYVISITQFLIILSYYVKMRIKDFLPQSFYVNFNCVMKVIGCQWVCSLTQICWIYEAKKFLIRPTIHQPCNKL